MLWSTHTGRTRRDLCWRLRQHSPYPFKIATCPHRWWAVNASHECRHRVTQTWFHITGRDAETAPDTAGGPRCTHQPGFVGHSFGHLLSAIYTSLPPGTARAIRTHVHLDRRVLSGMRDGATRRRTQGRSYRRCHTGMYWIAYHFLCYDDRAITFRLPPYGGMCTHKSVSLFYLTPT